MLIQMRAVVLLTTLAARPWGAVSVAQPTSPEVCNSEGAVYGPGAEAEESWLLQLSNGDAAPLSEQLLSRLQPELGSQIGAAFAGIGNTVQKLGWEGSSRLADRKVPISQLQTSRTSASLDRTDTEVLFYTFLILCFVISLAMCVCADAGKKPHATEDSKEAPVFPSASTPVKEDSMPVICSKLLSNNRDLPLIVPLEPLKAGGEWQLDACSNHTRQVVLSINLIHSGNGRHRSVVEVHSCKGKLLASIDSLLNIYYPDGEKFGQLMKLEEEYLLREENGREPRWSLNPVSDSSLCILWKPKGRRLPDGSAGVKNLLRQGLQKLGGLVQKTPVIASVARSSKSKSDRLEFMSLSGVDDVLVLLCTMGIIAFEHGFDLVEPSHPEVAKRPKIKRTFALR